MDALGLASVLAQLPRERTRLLDNLGHLRRTAGPVTPEIADALADHMNVRRGEVHEVVSFYSFLQLPVDTLRVCTGPVCDCKGARELLAQAQELAPEGVPVVEVPCLGHCDLAPFGTRGDLPLPHLTRRVLEDAATGRPVAPVTHAGNDGPALGLGRPDETLADYEARGGLDGLRSLPAAGKVIAELKASGLAGYGGAGFPMGLRCEAVLREPGPR